MPRCLIKRLQSAIVERATPAPFGMDQFYKPARMRSMTRRWVSVSVKWLTLTRGLGEIFLSNLVDSGELDRIKAPASYGKRFY